MLYNGMYFDIITTHTQRRHEKMTIAQNCFIILLEIAIIIVGANLICS